MNIKHCKIDYCYHLKIFSELYIDIINKVSFCKRDWVRDVEIADLTVDIKIQVQYPAYTHRMWNLLLQGGKRVLRMTWGPCRGMLGMLKTPSCPWRWVSGRRSELGN